MFIRLTGLAVLGILTAITVFAFATAPAGSTATAACGPVVQILDPGVRASFERFERTQSESAGKICSFYRNTVLASR